MLGAFLQAEPAASEKRACFELRRIPRPQLSTHHPHGSVLIRTTAASICGSDFCGQGPAALPAKEEENDSSPSSFGVSWRKPLDYLSLLAEQQICGGTGHELMGEVVEVVEPCRFHRGQQVLAFSPLYFKRVLLEDFQQRSGIKDLSVFEDQGGFAQFFISHEAVCLPIPKALPNNPTWDPNWFVLAQPLATAIHACERLDENITGKTVAIVGQGQNGLILTQLLSGYRPRRLIVLDILEERLKVAKKLYPVTHTVLVEQCDGDSNENTKNKILEITHNELCDVVVDMVGHQNGTLDLSAKLTKSCGTVLLFGLPPASDEPRHQFTIRACDFMRNLTYKTVSAPSMETFACAMELLEQGRFEPAGLFTHTMPFERFPEAYELAQNYRDGVIKVLLTFDESSSTTTTTTGTRMQKSSI